jgi:hypothetical protein
MKFHPHYLFAASTAVLLALSAPAGAGDNVRSFGAGHFMLDFDGASSWLRAAEGGHATAEVIEVPLGQTGFVKKHIGNPKYEDIALQADFSGAKPLYDWISASLVGKHMRKDGSIVAADFRNRVMNELRFTQALITEVTFPACDASDNDPGFLTVKLTPEITRAVKSGGSVPAVQRPPRVWRSANFRLTIDGLDTSRVTKIESFSIKQKLVEDPIGQTRDPRKEPGKLEFPNLKITFTESSAQSWLDWLEDFVIKGNAGDDKERGGTLEFLSPNRGEVLARVRFFNMGIFSLGQAKAARDGCNAGCPVDADAAHDALGKMTAELYVERMEFETPSTPQ